MTTMERTTVENLLEKVEGIRPIIEEHAERGEADRQLAPAVYEALRESGLLRMWVPARYGGLETHPAEAYRVFEALSEIDGAVGWNLNQHAAVSGMASWLRDGLDEIYADPDAVFCGVFWPAGSAIEVPGGYRVSANVRFASGCRYARWMMVPAINMVDGQPKVDPATGAPDFLAMWINMSEGQVKETWRTMGMRATGSNDVAVNEVFVPSQRVAHVFAMPAERPSVLSNPLYGMIPWPGVQAHAAVPVGIARAAVKKLVHLAQTKVPNFFEVTLRDRGVVQAQAAQARATVDAASAYLGATATAACNAIAAGRPLDNDLKIALQLSASKCASAAITATSLVQQAAGTSAIRDEAGFEKLFRDANTITQHAAVQTARYESTGKVMFGLTSDWFPFNL
jgi:alkylation response protein AidB-like acyl-CoA dehydrogenase